MISPTCSETDRRISWFPFYCCDVTTTWPRWKGLFGAPSSREFVIITMARGMVKNAGMVLEPWLRSHSSSTNRKWREHTGWT